MATSEPQAPSIGGDVLTYLRPYQFIQFTTFRKNGTGVPTPVWFAAVQDKLYVMTPSTTAKLKRLHNNSRVLLAPCNQSGKVLGEQVEASARELSTSASRSADEALASKYGFLYRVIAFFQRMRKIKRTFIEITL